MKESIDNTFFAVNIYLFQTHDTQTQLDSSEPLFKKKEEEYLEKTLDSRALD